MALGAATETALGGLHSKVAEVFTKILARYEARLDAIETMNADNIEDEMLREIFEDGALPNPAMLSAVTKFLKDNDIGFETEKLTELSDQERRLSERRDKRSSLASLSTLKVVGS